MASETPNTLLLLDRAFNTENVEIVSLASNEFTCKITLKNGSKHNVKAYLTSEYPQKPPIWVSFGDTEDADKIANLLRKLAEYPEDNTLFKQIERMICLLEMNDLITKTPKSTKQEVEYCEVLEKGDFFKQNGLKELPRGPHSASKEYKMVTENFDLVDVAGIRSESDSSPLNYYVRDEQKASEYFDKLNSKSYLSEDCASYERLIKELKLIYNSRNFKNHEYAVDLLNDDPYVWRIKYFKLSPKCLLYEDLQHVNAKQGVNHILFEANFSASFPSEPPSVNVVYPKIINTVDENPNETEWDFAKEIFDPQQNWSSIYTVESLLIQVVFNLNNSDFRIDHSKPVLANKGSVKLPKSHFTRT